ncbi:MAG TPA: metalloregulator ArsR/SmtB family transcription factor [Turneriella sp.]|nr:metalloregulator ArsR/SmtB family transcription factor [Turneriella sp.]
MQNKNTLSGITAGRKSVSAENIYLFKTEVLRALSDETRQGIIILLGKHGSLCVNDLTAHFNVGRPTVSHHLQVLKEAKVVKSEKQGKEMHYSLNLRNIKRSLRGLDKVLDSIDGETALTTRR